MSTQAWILGTHTVWLDVAAFFQGGRRQRWSRIPGGSWASLVVTNKTVRELISNKVQKSNSGLDITFLVLECLPCVYTRPRVQSLVLGADHRIGVGLSFSDRALA